MTKKTWWIIGGVVLISVISILVIAFRLAKKQTPLPAGLTEIQKLADPVAGLALNDRNETLYFDLKEQKFSQNGKAITNKLELKKPSGFTEIKWSDDKNAAVLRNGGVVYVYDFKAKKLNILNPNIKDAEFLGGDKLLTLVNYGNLKYLAEANYQGENPRLIVSNLSFDANNLVVSPDRKWAIISDANQYQLLNLSQGKAVGKPIFYQIANLEFSPDSSRFAFKTVKGDLVVVNLADNKRSTFHAKIKDFVWADANKIIFTSSTNSEDDVLAYNLKTKPLIETLANGAKGSRITSMVIKGDFLYFATKNEIFSLKIK